MDKQSTIKKFNNLEISIREDRKEFVILYKSETIDGKILHVSTYVGSVKYLRYIDALHIYGGKGDLALELTTKHLMTGSLIMDFTKEEYTWIKKQIVDCYFIPIEGFEKQLIFEG